MLIKKVKVTLINIIKLRAELEKITADYSAQDLGDLKLDEWTKFNYDMNERIVSIKDELQTLISGASAYLKEDRTES